MSSADNWLDESLMKAQFTDGVPQMHTDTQVNRKRHALQIKKKYTLEGFVFPVGGEKKRGYFAWPCFGVGVRHTLTDKNTTFPGLSDLPSLICHSHNPTQSTF